MEICIITIIIQITSSWPRLSILKTRKNSCIGNTGNHDFKIKILYLEGSIKVRTCVSSYSQTKYVPERNFFSSVPTCYGSTNRKRHTRARNNHKPQAEGTTQRKCLLQYCWIVLLVRRTVFCTIVKCQRTSFCHSWFMVEIK